MVKGSELPPSEDPRRQMALAWWQFGFEQIVSAVSAMAKDGKRNWSLERLKFDGIGNMHRARLRLNELRRQEGWGR